MLSFRNAISTSPTPSLTIPGLSHNLFISAAKEFSCHLLPSTLLSFWLGFHEHVNTYVTHSKNSYKNSLHSSKFLSVLIRGYQWCHYLTVPMESTPFILLSIAAWKMDPSPSWDGDAWISQVLSDCAPTTDVPMYQLRWYMCVHVCGPFLETKYIEISSSLLQRTPIKGNQDSKLTTR